MPESQKNNLRRIKKKNIDKYRRRSDMGNSGSARKCSACTSCTQGNITTRVHVEPYRREPEKTRSYRRIKWGLKKSNPAAIVLWVFHKIPSSNGLTARKIISYLKARYVILNNSVNAGKCIGSMLRCAVEFGLIQKRDDKYFLKRSVKSRS